MKSLLNRLLLSLLAFFLIPTAFAVETVRFEFNALDKPILKNIQSRLNLTEKSELMSDNPHQLVQNATGEIRKAIEPYGYFKPLIHSELSKPADYYLAKFNVQLGEPMIVTQVKVQATGAGQTDSKLQKFIANFPLHAGDVFNVEKYQEAKEAFFQTATEQGYIKSTFKISKATVDLNHNSVTINLLLDTHDRYYFGEVSFNQTPYDDAFLRRFITFKPSDPFSSKKLIAFQQSIATNVYFTKFMALPDFNHVKDHHVPIKITAEVPKSQKYTFGVGYGTLTGPRLTAGVSLRRLTASGQHLDAQIQLSSVLSSLAAKYAIPGANPLTDQWTLGANVQQFKPKNGQSLSGTLSGGYTTKQGFWTTNLSLNYLLERYQIKPDPTFYRSNILYPNFNINYTNTNDLLNPTKGYSATLNLQGASDAILSKSSFLQGELAAKYLFSPSNFNKIILRGDLGYTLVHDLNDLPLTMRFTTGGINSVRGFGDSSIGPGKYLQVGSIEYRNKLYGDLDGALFYDVGRASDHFDSPFNQGAGVGLVYNSMLGPVKFYVAHAITPTSHPNSFFFSLGPEF